MLRIYAITKAGRRISGNIASPKGEKTEVLQYLHDVNNSTIEDVASGTGLGSSRTSAVLRSLEKKGLVKEITRSHDNEKLRDYDYV